MRKIIFMQFALLLVLTGHSQQKVIGLTDAIRYIGYAPAVAGDTLKKYGFKQTQNIGHPWQDDQAGSFTYSTTSQFITVSPRKNGKGCELLIMYEGLEVNAVFDRELIKENFEKIGDYPVDEISVEENWYWKGASTYGKTLFAERKYMKKQDPASRSYFIYIHFDFAQGIQYYDKREPELIFKPGKKYNWETQNVWLMLPDQAEIKRTRTVTDSLLNIIWAGGDWAVGPVVMESIAAKNPATGKTQEPIGVVGNKISDLVSNRTDSLIYKYDTKTKMGLFLIESDGVAGDKRFTSTFFALNAPRGKIIFGSYISMNPVKGEPTRKKLRQSVLATYYELIK